jgi:hypothetical protein
MRTDENQGQTDRSAAPCFRKPTPSSATDLTPIATPAGVLRLPSPAVTRSVAPPPLRAPSGGLEKKGRLAVRIRRRPDRKGGRRDKAPAGRCQFGNFNLSNQVLLDRLDEPFA